MTGVGEIGSLVVDFGLVVIIWMTQLVVYPSFDSVDASSFRSWHASYTRRISFVVVPLMIAQLGLHSQHLFEVPSLASSGSWAFVILAWVVTFAVSVPCHRTLSRDGKSDKVIARLIKSNWIRTAFWTWVFLISAVDLLS